MKHIGRSFEYFTASGEKRFATCVGIDLNSSLGKPVFIGISPFGNRVRLSREEINKFN